MIVIGFPGIGKSTYEGLWNGRDYIDFESSNFYYEEEDGEKIRDPHWIDYYINIILDMDTCEDRVIFVSSHADVQNRLSEYAKFKYIVIAFPTLDIKDKWIRRLEYRYQEDPSEKNRLALEYTKNNYEDMVNAARKSPFIKLPITSTQYNLINLIDKMA